MPMLPRPTTSTRFVRSCPHTRWSRNLETQLAVRHRARRAASLPLVEARRPRFPAPSSARRGRRHRRTAILGDGSSRVPMPRPSWPGRTNRAKTERIARSAIEKATISPSTFGDPAVGLRPKESATLSLVMPRRGGLFRRHGRILRHRQAHASTCPARRRRWPRGRWVRSAIHVSLTDIPSIHVSTTLRSSSSRTRSAR